MNKTRFLDSERLYLRKLTEADAERMFKLHSDERVMKYMRTLEPPPTGTSQMLNMIERFARKNKGIPGTGFWAVILKETESFVGWIFLQPFKEEIEGDLEIGYRFFPQFWKKGYCTEISASLIKNTLNRGIAKQIVAIVNPDNKASLQVLMKLGFKYIKKISYHDYPMPFYVVDSSSLVNPEDP
jgi:[ribosomal protein S5]-alanine N-acetyltransferase